MKSAKFKSTAARNAEIRSAEIICVGTELLLGDIVNGNARYLAQQLASLGIAHHYQTVVGDNPLRIQRAVAIACERARLIIFTGGLGPTPDDLTMASLAEFFDAPLVENPAVVVDLEAKFARRGRQLNAASRRQAQLPAEADVLPNPVGTAPGVIWEARPGLLIMTFPGVPHEMKAMWQATAAPYLHNNGWAKGVIHSQTLKFWGIGEETLASKVRPLLDLENPTVAPYAGEGEVKLRISAKAESVAAANALIDPVAREIRKISGNDCYGADDDTLASTVGELLQQKSMTLSVAESCTGGGLGEYITATPGSSRYFWGGIISYDNRVKQGLLGVDARVLERCGAVSAEVATAMAQGVRDRLGTDWGISITGIAGPDGGSPEKPVGLVYIGLASAAGVQTQKHLFGSDRSRDRIRQQSALSALNWLRLQLLEQR
ncbi:MAG: nicotinamide mononucleotide deamidase PncC [Phormidesmis priestleyi Ana]|uniref:CinA-like protein n=1 Tax=Phormidesmis priestleyi Ana TaxID=1666911 RepID=A0A0P8C304_9CYAN|nr:MAG: nicotinamide mononucleotide deamidase PncC [Phormidesmis priestleyi Ana]